VHKHTSVYFPILTDPRILLFSGDNKFGTHSGDCKEERNRNADAVSSIKCAIFSKKKCYLVISHAGFLGDNREGYLAKKEVTKLWKTTTKIQSDIISKPTA